MSSDYSTLEREWLDEDVYCVGGGPSLKGFDFSLLKDKRVIGCNDAYHLGGDIIKILVFGDAGWWHRNRMNLETFTGRVATNAPSMKEFQVPGMLKFKRERDGYHKGDTLGWNYSTGALAINLAVNLGARRVLLLGYDLANHDGQSHWHHLNSKTTQDASFARFLRGFHMLQRHLPVGVDVANVTDGTSKLKCFREMTFNELHQHLARAPLKEAA